MNAGNKNIYIYQYFIKNKCLKARAFLMPSKHNSESDEPFMTHGINTHFFKGPFWHTCNDNKNTSGLLSVKYS